VSRLYLRNFKLVVSDNAGNGYDLSELRVLFKIDKKDNQTPANCMFSIYNVSNDTRNRFIRGEFTKVFLEAGYGDNSSTIFTGNIKDKRVGSENSVDTFVEVLAGDGDVGLNFSLINTTLAAGSRPADHIDACYSALSGYGIDKGQIDSPDSYELPRGKTMFGSTKSHLRKIGFANQMSLTVQDSALQGLKHSSSLKQEAVVLNTKTGLVGSPVLTAEGVNVKMLLNPQLKIGSILQIESSLIQREALQQQDTEVNGNTESNGSHATLASNGIYRVIALEHVGDNRGNDWYTTVVCVSMDSSLPSGEQAYAG